MALKVSCPNCQQNYQLADNLAGRIVRCQRCQHEFRVATGEAPRATPPGEPRRIDTAIRKDKASSSARLAPQLTQVESSAAEQPEPQRSGKQVRHWVVGGVIGAALLVACTVVGASLLRKPATATAVGDSTVPAVAVKAESPATAAPRAGDAGVPSPNAGATPEAAALGDQSIPLPTLQAIKDATVFVKVEAGQLSASGSGFVMSTEGDTALIVSNQHVVNPSFKFVYEPPLPGPGARPRIPGLPVVPPPPPPRIPTPGRARRRIAVVDVHVVTVKDAQVTVVFGSGTPQEHSHRAEILAADEAHDLAILKVIGVPRLPPPIQFLHDVQLVETMPIFSFGFPFGKALATSKAHPAITVGKGSLSSIRLDDSGELAIIQIDGALNPGNSGGPIVDSRGRLIGVAVAIIKDANNIGLAIPARQLRQLAQGGVGSIDLKVVKQEAQKLEVEVSAQIIDLGKRINAATFHYRTGPPTAGAVVTKEAFGTQPDTQKLDLKIEQGKATGRFTLAVPAAGSELSLTSQVALGDLDGKTMLMGLTEHKLRPQSAPPVPGTPSLPSPPVAQDKTEGGPTTILGGAFDPEFKDAAPSGGLLIGFEVGLGKFFANDVVRAIRPIFRTADGREVLGGQHGTDISRVVTVKAKPGYAVGAITGKAGLTLDGFSVTFMAVGAGRLDPSQSYTSEWIGGKGGGPETRLGGSGTYVIGIVGKQNAKDCTGLGLLLPGGKT